MATDDARERLSAKRYVTVSLRLLVGPDGQVVQGELVDPQGRSPRRFVGWRGLARALRAAIAQQGAGRPSSEAAGPGGSGPARTP